MFISFIRFVHSKMSAHDRACNNVYLIPDNNVAYSDIWMKSHYRKEAFVQWNPVEPGKCPCQFAADNIAPESLELGVPTVFIIWFQDTLGYRPFARFVTGASESSGGANACRIIAQSPVSRLNVIQNKYPIPFESWIPPVYAVEL